jgi:Domain of unknown function (DUF6468)
VTNLLGLVFDGGLAVLLMVTIGYCRGLSRRIKLLQAARGELGGIVAQFDQATGRAMTTLAELQTVSQRITEGLQLKIDKANFLADDLAFLIEKSTKLAVQLDSQAKAMKQEAVTRPKPVAETAPSTPAKPKLASWQPDQNPQQAELSSSVKSTASIEALLNRLASSGGLPPGSLTPAVTKQPAPKQERTQSAARTGAERELLEALKSGR